MFAIDVAIKAHQNAAANAVLAFAVRNILAISSIPPQGWFHHWFTSCVAAGNSTVALDLLSFQKSPTAGIDIMSVRYMLEIGNGEVLEAFLRSGTFSLPQCTFPLRSSKRTALVLALENARFKGASVLLRHGADVNEVSDRKLGVSAFWRAANAGDERRVRFLLDNGAHANTHEGWRSPLQVARVRGDKVIIGLLWAAKVHSNDQDLAFVVTIADLGTTVWVGGKRSMISLTR
tara:strand:- start:21146 stop:21844 length:699 start_codon:yes stop_codon:yes gene_type:complete